MEIAAATGLAQVKRNAVYSRNATNQRANAVAVWVPIIVKAGVSQKHRNVWVASRTRNVMTGIPAPVMPVRYSFPQVEAAAEASASTRLWTAVVAMTEMSARSTTNAETGGAIPELPSSVRKGRLATASAVNARPAEFRRQDVNRTANVRMTASAAPRSVAMPESANMFRSVNVAAGHWEE